jgi:hypothetical protein
MNREHPQLHYRGSGMRRIGMPLCVGRTARKYLQIPGLSETILSRKTELLKRCRAWPAADIDDDALRTSELFFIR